MRIKFVLFGLFLSITTPAFSQVDTLDTMLWLGVDSSWGEFYNWSRNGGAGGIPSLGDSIVIPGNIPFSPVIDGPIFNTVGAIRILPNGNLRVVRQANLNVRKTVTIDSSGILFIGNDSTYILNDDIIINGQFRVDSAFTPIIICRGNWLRGRSSAVSTWRSTFEFLNSERPLLISKGTFYNLVLDVSEGMVTAGLLSVNKLLSVKSKLFTGGNLSLSDSARLSLGNDIQLRAGDTLSIRNSDSSAITGLGRVRKGTLIRAIDSTQARTGAYYRFNTLKTFIQFAPRGTPPSGISISIHSDSFLTCIDTSLIYRGFYDIDPIGGSDFRARISLPFDFRISPTTPLQDLRLYRARNNCALIDSISLSRTDTSDSDSTTNCEVDSVDGFSKWTFGHTPRSTDVGDEAGSVPTQFSLAQNYPNPFNPSTEIQYSVPSGQYVSLRIYDILGREVATLVNEKKEPGEYSVSWNAGDKSRQTTGGLASGVYYYKLQTEKFIAVKKMLLIR